MAERVYKLRTFDGIDLTSDARIDNPRAWRELKNLYPREPGVLSKRPGSSVIYDAISYGAVPISGPPPEWKFPADPTIKLPQGKFPVPDLLTTENIDVDYNQYAIGVAPTGGKLVELAFPASTNIHDIFKDGHTPGDILIPEIIANRIAGLGEIILDADVASSRVVVGALNFENAGDRPFFVTNDEDIGNRRMVIPAVTPAWSTSVGDEPGTPIEANSARGADWFFQNIYGNFADKDQLLTGVLTYLTLVSPGDAIFYLNRDMQASDKLEFAFTHFGIAVNGQDMIMAIVPDQTLNISNAVAFLPMRTYWDRTDPAFDKRDTTNYADIYAPRHMTIYDTTVVYAGYQRFDYDKDQNEDESHWIAFSESWEPFSVGINSRIQIGESPADPVYAVASSSIDTDTAGIRAQLLAFTRGKMHVFDGVPPNLGGSGTLAETVVQPVGCVSPRTVVNTPAGTMFLGSDGNMYLWNRSHGLVEVGRAIEPFLTELTYLQQHRACAVYEDGFYRLSVPDVSDAPGDNSCQFWADIRGFAPGQRDGGVTWSGKHVGQWISCFVRTEFTDVTQPRLIAGGSISPEIYDVNNFDSSVDPFTPKSQTPMVDDPIEIRAISPQIDLGDAHLDKELVAVNFGIGSNIGTVVDVTANIDSSSLCGTGTGQSEAWTQRVDPCSDVLGVADPDVTFQLGGGSIIGSALGARGRAHDLVDLWPSQRLVGRAFTVTITEQEATTVGATVELADFSILFNVISRRGGDGIEVP